MGDTIEVSEKAIDGMPIGDLLALAESLGVVTNVTDISDRETLIRTLKRQSLSS